MRNHKGSHDGLKKKSVFEINNTGYSFFYISPANEYFNSNVFNKKKKNLRPIYSKLLFYSKVTQKHTL